LVVFATYLQYSKWRATLNEERANAAVKNADKNQLLAQR
jgi:hypothetical protein